MSENRKYYYLKLKENFFTSEKMVILESMQDGLLYSNLLLKMYLMSLKYNGILMLNDRLPHTPQTIATLLHTQYLMDLQEAEQIESFLLPMLQCDPRILFLVPSFHRKTSNG